MTLFRAGDFSLHAGGRSGYKIDCDALTLSDWVTLAGIVGPEVRFSRVVGVPRGGLIFAACLWQYAKSVGPRLVVDDVLTTGVSMAEMRQPGDIGVVVFARGPCPEWVTPIFQMGAFGG